MRFKFLEPMYGFGADLAHIAVPDGAESMLKAMSDELVGTDDLIAVYIPEGTEEVYQAGHMRGRVVGAVRLVPMPTDKTIRDYHFKDWDGSPRWPIGWPCRVVYSPQVDLCPVLRSLVDILPGGQHFQPYVARLQYGPMRLETRMAKILMERFRQFDRQDITDVI